MQHKLKTKPENFHHHIDEPKISSDTMNDFNPKKPSWHKKLFKLNFISDFLEFI